MKYFILFLASAFATGLGAQSSEERILRYIERYKDIAVQEMERAGIPASIKLAQGLLESGVGTSYLAKNANNHFGIKCGRNWNGREVYRKDDDYDDKGQLIKSCFRGYRNANASYVAHSEFLRNPKKAFRYGFLFRLNPRDYKKWAEGLRRAGYATDPNYPAKLISRIEKYNLHQYDRLPINDGNGNSTVVTRPGTTRPGTIPGSNTNTNSSNSGNDNTVNPAPTDVNTPIENLVTGFLNTNDVTYFVSDEAISVDEVARRVDISVRKIIEYNEPLASGQQKIKPGQRVFIQKKRKSYRGREKYHVMQIGETLQEISDRYAVRMDKLLKRNKLVSPEQRVAPGEKIKLRGASVSKPPRLGLPPSTDNTDSQPPAEEENTGTDNTTTTPYEEEEEPTTTVVTPVPTAPIPSPNSPSSDNNTTNTGSTPTRPTVDPTVPTRPPVTPNTSTTTTTTAPDNVPTTTTTTVDPPYSPPPPPPTPPVSKRKHTVAKGDTLYNISRRYNTSVDRIKQLNGLNSNTINIGQVLIVEN